MLLTQAEKRLIAEEARRGIVSPPPVVAPPVRVQVIVRRMPQQSDNHQAKIKFGQVARELLPLLAAAWDNGL